VIGLFLSMEVLCGFSKMVKNVGIMEGRLRVDWIVNLEFQSCCPCLCRIRPASVVSE
jgi:hypothetical protein